MLNYTLMQDFNIFVIGLRKELCDTQEKDMPFVTLECTLFN